MNVSFKIYFCAFDRVDTSYVKGLYILILFLISL